METTQTLPPPAETLAGSRFAPLIFAAKIAALLAAVFATVFAFSLFVKDGNDYADASVLKHKLLAMDAPKKIVLVGGSNISYGLDSDVITEKTGCPVVNMGMNGYFGVRFMLEEVKPYLKFGDIVVVTWEYDNFFKSVEGADTDLLMVTKANPGTLKFLTPEQKMGVITSYPFAAQQKGLRLFDGAIESAQNASQALFGIGTGPTVEGHVDVLQVESVKSFDPGTGDLDGHVGLTWPYAIEDGMDLSSLPIDDGVLPLMADFIAEMEARGVHVMISWSAAADTFYAKHRDAIEEVNSQMSSNPVFRVPRPARDFVFDTKYHFDTVYHLNPEGRAIRSPMVAEDIISQFGNDAFCVSARETASRRPPE